MSLVSTITPCYKAKAYLKGFLEDLPQQTMFEDLEVVLDHNDPDEEEITWVKDFQEKYPGRLKHVITNPVEPIGVSMNTCIKEASADTLCIWNVDDLRAPYSIEAQYKAIKGDVELVNGNFTIVNEWKSYFGNYVDHALAHATPKEYTRSMILGPFFMFKKSLCEKGGYFDEQLKSGADFDLAIRLVVHAKEVALVRENLGWYLNEGKGASTRGDGRQPIERTVIEMRYGILDKIDAQYLQGTREFNIHQVFNFGKGVDVESLIPEYKKFIGGNFSFPSKEVHEKKIKEIAHYYV
tara:strand:- start:2076 stop:2960 length:885 start_codon:yes stop_codon:yes gene_type:complete